MIFDQLQFEQLFVFGLTVRLVKLWFLKKLQQINQFSSSFWNSSEVSKKKFWAIQVWRVAPFEKKFQFITLTKRLKTKYIDPFEKNFQFITWTKRLKTKYKA